MIIYIKLKKYLRNYLVYMRDAESNLIYGEPVTFSRKNKIGQMLDAWRRKPGTNAKEFPYELPEESEHTFLAVNVDPSMRMPEDEQRVYLSEHAQQLIASEIYDQFCANAFAYVEDHLNGQRQVNPYAQPQKKFAFINFLEDLQIENIDWNTVRRAYDREKKNQEQKKDKNNVKFQKKSPV